jgi:hypothetical protein
VSAAAASEPLQDLQEDEGQLDDPWSREAGPEEGMPVLAGALLLLHCCCCASLVHSVC